MAKFIKYLSQWNKSHLVISSMTVLFISAFTNLCHCQTVINLESVFKNLESKNTEILQLRFQQAIAKQDIKEAKNLLLPRLSFEANHTSNLGFAFDQVAGQLITGNKLTNYGNININAQTNIYKGLAIRNQIKSAILELESTQLEEESLIKVLKLKLLQVYFTAIINKALYSSGLEQLKYSEKQLNSQYEQLEAGTKTTIDVSLAESQVETDKLNLLTNNNNYQNSILELKELLNIPISESIILSEPDTTKFLEANGFQITHNLHNFLQQNIFLKLSDMNIQKAEIAQKTAKNLRYPSISLSAAYATNYSSQRLDFLTNNYMSFWNQLNQNKALYIGASISIPIFNNKIRSEIIKAKINLSIQESLKEKEKLSQEKIHTQALQELLLSRKNYIVAEKKYKSLKNTLNAMNERYNLGVASSIDFGKAILEHNQAQFDVITAHYNVIYNKMIIEILFSII